MLYGGGRTKRVQIRFQCFAIIDPTDGELPGEVLCHADGQTRRERIRRAAIDIPAIFVRLPAVKGGRLQLNGTVNKTERDHTVRNVRRVLLVVPKYSDWVFRCRRSMRIRRRPERRFTDGSSVDEKRSVFR